MRDTMQVFKYILLKKMQNVYYVLSFSPTNRKFIYYNSSKKLSTMFSVSPKIWQQEMSTEWK